MFEYLKGNLIEIDAQKAIIDINGIGYKVFIPTSVHTEFINKKEIFLYISYIVKEDAQVLYGFITKVQRNVFEMLTTVSGIGAKTALLLLSHFDIGTLHLAITNADIRLISKVPGIGKKTSERLIVELRDKFKHFVSHSDQTYPKESSNISDAIGALMNLGYSSLQAQKAVKNVIQDFEKEPDLSTLITAALRKI